MVIYNVIFHFHPAGTNNGVKSLPIPVSLNWHEIQEYEQAFKDFDQNGDGTYSYFIQLLFSYISIL